MLCGQLLAPCSRSRGGVWNVYTGRGGSREQQCEGTATQRAVEDNAREWQLLGLNCETPFCLFNSSEVALSPWNCVTSCRLGWHSSSSTTAQAHLYLWYVCTLSFAAQGALHEAVLWEQHEGLCSMRPHHPQLPRDGGMAVPAHPVPAVCVSEARRGFPSGAMQGGSHPPQAVGITSALYIKSQQTSLR